MYYHEAYFKSEATTIYTKMNITMLAYILSVAASRRQLPTLYMKILLYVSWVLQHQSLTRDKKNPVRGVYERGEQFFSIMNCYCLTFNSFEPYGVCRSLSEVRAFGKLLKYDELFLKLKVFESF